MPSLSYAYRERRADTTTINIRLAVTDLLGEAFITTQLAARRLLVDIDHDFDVLSRMNISIETDKV